MFVRSLSLACLVVFVRAFLCAGERAFALESVRSRGRSHERACIFAHVRV